RAGRSRPAGRPPAAAQRTGRTAGTTGSTAGGRATGPGELLRPAAMDYLRRHPPVRRYHAGVHLRQHAHLPLRPGVRRPTRSPPGRAPPRGPAGGWLPAVHKVVPIDAEHWYDVLVFADVDATDRFVVQTWHRTMLVEHGKPG